MDLEGADNSIISKKKIKHITNRHSYNKFKDEIPNLLKKYTREQVEELISKRTFFDKSWSDDKIAKVAQEVYSKYASLGETGNIPITYEGNDMLLVIQEDGSFGTLFGLNKYTLSDFGY